MVVATLGMDAKQIKPVGADAAVPDLGATAIRLQDVVVEFPVHNSGSYSLQLTLAQMLGFKVAQHKRADTVRALRGVSFEVANGERVGIVGHNGSGKTTLLRTIAGAYPATSGVVETSGRVMSMTDFTLGMDPEASGRENVILRGVFMGMTFSQIRDLADDVIDFAGLKDFGDLPMRTYSTGMYLRLAFAVSTLIVPDILILDEVISAGDLGFQERFEQRLESFIGSSRAVVLASHDLGALRRWCTRAIWMREGQVVADGPVDNIIDDYIRERR